MKLSLSDELKPYWLSERYSVQSRQFADWLNVLRTGWINKYGTKPRTKGWITNSTHNLGNFSSSDFSIDNPAVVIQEAHTSRSHLRVHGLRDRRANASRSSSKFWTANAPWPRPQSSLVWRFAWKYLADSPLGPCLLTEKVFGHLLH